MGQMPLVCFSRVSIHDVTIKCNMTMGEHDHEQCAHIAPKRNQSHS